MKILGRLAIIALVFIGFRFVTQSGQDSLFQNDGYAVTGGIMLLVGGFLAGRFSNILWDRRITRKQAQQMSAENLEKLEAYGDKLLAEQAARDAKR